MIIWGIIFGFVMILVGYFLFFDMFHEIYDPLKKQLVVGIITMIVGFIILSGLAGYEIATDIHHIH